MLEHVPCLPTFSNSGMILLTFLVFQAVLGSVLSTFREDTLGMERQKFVRPGEGTEFNEDWEEVMWGFFGWGKEL